MAKREELDGAQRLKRGLAILRSASAVGRENAARLGLSLIGVFRPYFKKDGSLDVANLDERDGTSLTRREAIVRYLLLCAVLDQGPDIEGLRQFVSTIVNNLYEKEVRVFHRPLDFFKEVHVSVDQIQTVHEVVKKARSETWAKANETKPGRYLLYADGAKQTLGYAIARWGTPLALPYLLEKRASAVGKPTHTALVDYLKSFPSTEKMRIAIKEHPGLGLGKMIGDKAAHLFGKWMVHSYPLLSNISTRWDAWSYELPFDSNAGRVLYRTGFFDLFLKPDDYYTDNERTSPLRKGGKGDAEHLRVTNLRGIASDVAREIPEIVKANEELCVFHLASHKRRPTKIEIQRVPSALGLIDKDFNPGEIDDGLIKVGTTWCFNHDNPDCPRCPLNKVCAAANGHRELITEVKT